MSYSVRRGGRPVIPDDQDRCTEDVSSSFRSSRCTKPRKPSDDYPTMCGTHAAAKRRVEANNARRRRKSEWRDKRGTLVQQRNALLVEILRTGTEWGAPATVVRDGAMVGVVIMPDDTAARMQGRFSRYAELQRKIRAVDLEYSDVDRDSNDYFTIDQFRIPSGA